MPQNLILPFITLNTLTIMANRIGGYLAGAVPPSAKRKEGGKFDNLPPKVDLREHLTEVEEQVGNSCVANAFAGAYEYLAKRINGESADVSRLYIYYNARYLNESQDEDAGSYMSKAIEGLKEYGACAEELWANNPDNILAEPDGSAYEHGANFKIVDAEYVEVNLELWKQTLAEGYPIAFSLNTFDSFDNAKKNKGRVPMPKDSDNVRETHGWHAMLCVGYSDPDKVFIVRNSWGNDWGDKGYCYIPYNYLMHSKYNGNDSWIIKSVENLDFSEGVWDETEESNFAEEGMVYLTDFWIQAEDMDDFADKLEKLCLKYVENEEDYYFDYEAIEQEGVEYTYINHFEIITEHFDDFIAEVETLCEENAIEGDYNFVYSNQPEEESEEGEVVEEEEEEEVEEETEEAATEVMYLTDFWIMLDDADEFVAELEKLCLEYVENEEDYSFEYETSEEDGYTYVNDFSILTPDFEGFVGDLEALCTEMAIEEDYDFSYQEE
jgi:hypothetical protein